MKVKVTIGGDKFVCEQGKCYIYGVDRQGGIFEHEEITHRQYKEYTQGMTRLYDWMAGDCSKNIELWDDDNGGVFVVNSKGI